MRRSNQPNRKVTDDDSDYNYEGTSNDDDDDDDYEYYAKQKPKNASISTDDFQDQNSNSLSPYQQDQQAGGHLSPKHRARLQKSKQKHFNISHRKPRRLFTPEEDRLLLSLVEQLGVNSWIEISEKIPGRSSRQCKERYVTYLCPNVNHSPWTDEEDLLLVQKVNEMGKRWSDMSKFFNGRTANAIKNRYHLHLRGHYSESRSKHRNQIQNQIHQQFQRHLMKRNKDPMPHLSQISQQKYPQIYPQPYQLPLNPSIVQPPMQTAMSLPTPVIYTTTTPQPTGLATFPNPPINFTSNPSGMIMIPATYDPPPKPIPVQTNIQFSSFVNYQRNPPPPQFAYQQTIPTNAPEVSNIGVISQPMSNPACLVPPNSYSSSSLSSLQGDSEIISENSDQSTRESNGNQTKSSYNISNLLVDMVENVQDEQKVVPTKSKILLPPLRLCFPL